MRMSKLRRFCKCCYVVLATVLAWQTVFAEAAPLALVQDTTTRLLAALRSERQAIERNPARLHELVEQILLPVVDREQIARWVLGKYWRRASPEQRARFIEEFQTMLVRTYSAPLLGHLDVEIDYRPFQAEADAGDATVRTEIRATGREAIPVNYSLHRRKGEWKVYDVTIAGVSAVVTLRSTYSEEIQKLGLEEFIRRLAEKNRQRI